MNRPIPKDLPCFTTSNEMDGIARAGQSSGFAELLNKPIDPTIPDDPEMLENEKLFLAGKKDEWFEKEMTRWFAKKYK